MCLQEWGNKVGCQVTGLESHKQDRDVKLLDLSHTNKIGMSSYWT